MSTPTATSNREPNWKEGLSDHQVNMALVKRMKGTHGYNPIPPAQHHWQMADAGGPGLHRLWSWICAHTIHFGHRSEYAIASSGEELHIEHAAAALKMEEHNARAYWREGVERGLWRPGTPKEGKRRLYLCGEITPQSAEEEGAKGVCTDPLPPYISKQIKDWSPEKRAACVAEFQRNQRIEKDVLAELVAAGRLICEQQLHDTWIRKWEIEKIRLERKAKGSAEEEGERQTRLSRIAPVIEGFVQTLLVPVQTVDSTLHIVANGSVQGDFDGPTLLRSETARERQSGRADSALNGPAPVARASHSQDGKKSVHLPADETQAPPTDPEAEAAATLLDDVAGIQKALPKRFSSEWPVVDPENAGDRAWALRVVRAANPAEVAEFLIEFRQRITNRKGLGHQVGPGLVLEWASDFHRGAEARRQRKDEQAASAAKQRQLDEQRRDARDRDDKLTVWMEDTWERMPAEQRAGELARAEAAIKADPVAVKRYRDLPSTTRKELVENRAKSKLKEKLAAQQAAKGATP